MNRKLPKTIRRNYPRPLRIAILGSRGYPYVYSGYETFIQEVAPRLVSRGHQVTVYCHRSLFKDRPSYVSGVNLVYLPSIEKKVLSQLSHSFVSTLHVLFQKIDIVLYVNSANGPMGLFTFLINKKTAINVDGLEWLRPKWKGLGAKYFRFASYLSTKFFNVVITDSERMADIYKSEFNCPSITIAYGANIGYSSKPELINKLRLTANDYYLVVGRLVPDNNADLIVRGFVRSDSKRKLVILGDVPYKDKYAESVRSTTDERVLFPGYVRDQNLLRELYCNSYVYIHGHEFGGTNPALLKALGYGCCVLALDTQFNREVLEGEKYGVYFSKNEESIVKMLGQVDLNESIVIQKKNIARERITSNYTWGKITSQYEELFRSMVDSSN